MKVKLNPMFEGVSGQLGEMVFRELRGETVVSRKPTLSGGPTENQLEHRERFKLAAAYGKAALADADTRALYEQAAKAKDMPVFALTVADFFNTPTIGMLDLNAYNGQLGSQIKVSASDDCGVASVRVTIMHEDDSVVESGNAIETAQGSGLWVYTVLNSIGAGTVVNVRAVATDRPGGTAVTAQSKTL